MPNHAKKTSVHYRSVCNRFAINTFLQYSPYPAIYRIKVRTVKRLAIGLE